MKFFKRFIFYLAVIFIVLFLLMMIITAFMTFAEYKLDITSNIMFDSILQTARHPFHYGITAVKEKNPLAVIGSIAVIGYILFLYFKSFTTEKSWKADKNDTHGSAKWIDGKSLSKNQNYNLVSYTHLYDEWKKSIQ